MPRRSYSVEAVPTVRGGALAYLFNGGQIEPAFGFEIFVADVVGGKPINKRRVCVGASFDTEAEALAVGRRAMDRYATEAAAIEGDREQSARKCEWADERAVRIERQFGGYLR